MEGIKKIAQASKTAASAMATVKKMRVEGLCSPPVSPFTENGEVNLDFVPKYVQHFVDFGIKNAFIIGTNGEGLSMSVPERKLLAERWIKEARGKLDKVIVHVGTGNMVESQELAKHAEEIGADVIACVGPTYFKPETMDCYIQYMANVANAAPKTPFMLYDIDFVTGITYNSTDFFTKAKGLIPTLSGMKHTSPDIVSIHNVHLTHPEMELLLGTDEFFLEGLSIGVEGDITSSFFGNVHRRMIEAFEKGDMVTARLEQSRCVQVGAIRRKLGFSIAGGTKAILMTMGMEVGQPRLPLASIPDEKLKQLKEELTAIGFFEWACAK